MRSYILFIKNNRRFLSALLIISFILALVGISQIQIGTERFSDIFVLEDSEYQLHLEEMRSYFPEEEQIIFLVERSGTHIDSELMVEFRKFQRYLENKEEVRFVNGPAPDELMTGADPGDRIEIDSLINNRIPEQELKKIQGHYQRLEKFSPLIIEEGKIYGSFIIFAGEDFSRSDLNAVEDYLENNNMQYYASGEPYLQQKLVDYIEMILSFLPPLALVLLLSVFYLQMGSVKAAVFSLLPAAAAALWTMGIVGWSGREVSIITVLAPLFTIVIGSADGLHFVSHVQEARNEAKNRVESLVETLSMLGSPLVITTLTSMIGFLSLLIMETPAIRDLALFASTGILLAGIATWYILPLLLTGKINLPAPPDFRRPLLKSIKALWGIPSFVLLILLVGIVLIGFPRVSTEFNQLMIYREDTEVYRSFEKVMKINEGSIPLYILVEMENDPLHPDNAQKLNAFQEKLSEYDEVSRINSIYDFYSMMYMTALELESPDYPENMMTINFLSSMLEGQDFNPEINLVNRDRGITRIMVFPVDLNNSTLDRISSKVQAFDQSHPELSANITGGQYLIRELNAEMIENQASTLIIAFLFIFILLYLSLKNIRISLISLVPIAFTVVILYGFLGLSGITLNVATTTIFSITLGVGIDYAIHFTSIWKNFKNKGFDSEEAAQRSFNYTARPILANAFGLSLGLSGLLLSPLRIHNFISALMWVSMISGVFLSLSLLPTILKKLK